MSDTRRSAIRSFSSWVRPVLKLLDLAAIVAGLFVLVTWMPECNSRSTIVIGLVAMGMFSMAGEFAGLYRNWQGVAFLREGSCAAACWGLTVLGLLVLGTFSIYSTELSAGALGVWLFVTPVFALGFRILFRRGLRWYCESAGATRGFAVVGANALGVDLVRNIRQQNDLGLSFLGFIDDRPDDRSEPLPEDANCRLGGMERLVERARKGEIPVVFITLPLRAEVRIRQIVERLADTTCSVYIVPDLFVFQLLHSRWTDIQGIPAVSVYENPFYGVDGICKRLCDIVFALAGLFVAALPMLVIALLVRFSSPGPVIFRQRRYGLDGREIEVWKFRTMRALDNGPTVKQATRNDPRITRVGAFLRKTSLDELPQLFNVLGGSMSLVGPRPHATAHNEFYRGQIDGYMLRHKVKPGITGLAQVNGCRGETDQLEKMERRVFWDHRYIRDWSLALDLQILWRTFGVVFSRQNAY
jgi:putative colanic acid biosysnthesis UDP-glucose lipid carrier transferase